MNVRLRRGPSAPYSLPGYNEVEIQAEVKQLARVIVNSGTETLVRLAADPHGVMLINVRVGSEPRAVDLREWLHRGTSAPRVIEKAFVA